MLRNTLLILTISLSLFSCSDNSFKKEKIFAGSKVVQPEVLNKGKMIYAEYCMPCHGVKGDGKGVSAKAMKVPPRDFTTGVFKFGHVLAGELPHDKDLFEILEKGLHGTAMLPWDLSEGQMEAVVQYIKTFAPDVWEGKDKALGERITVSKDPYGEARRSAAIEKGKEVYHITAECWSCHRAYVSNDELNRMARKINGEPYGEMDEEAFRVKSQETEWGFQNIPPDFTWDSVRSAETVEELYIRLAAGVGGTTMPAWKDTITDDEIWAVAYYVRSLMDLKDGLNERKRFLDGLKK